jgi:autotransporter-associated beta strand protein
MNPACFRLNPWLRSTPLASAIAVFTLTSLSQAQITGNWTYNGTVATSLSWGNTSTVTSPTNLRSWSTAPNIPDSIDATANFNFNITSGRTITLDGDRTVGTMAIDDPSSSFQSYTFNAGAPATSGLIFDVSSGSASLTAGTANNTQTNAINVRVTLNAPLVITTTRTNVAGGISLAGTVTDGAASHAITKNGNGQLTLGAANNYDGGTTINGGRVQANVAASYGSGTVAVANGGQAYLATTAGVTFANNFTIAGNGYSNTIDAAAFNGAIRYQNNTTTGTITLTGDAGIGAFGATQSGTLAGPLVGNFNLGINPVAGSGQILLNGNASGMTGTITVNQGSLGLGPDSNLGGNLVVKDGARLSGEATTAGSLQLGNPGSTTSGATLAFDPSSSTALAVGGGLTLNGTTTVALDPKPFAGGNLPIVSYTGTLTGDLTNLSFNSGNSRPGTGLLLDPIQKLISLNVVSKGLVWTGALNNEWNYDDPNWADGASSSNFFDLDGVTFNIAADHTSLAAFTTGLTGPNNDLTFTAIAPGADGEAISIQYLDAITPGTPFGISVTGNAIQVTLAIDSGNFITTTAANIKAAIEGNAAAAALVSVAFAPGNDGSGLIPDGGLPVSNLFRAGRSVTIPSGVAARPSSATFDLLADNGFRLSGPGTLTNTPILKKGSGKLTVGDATNPASTTSVVTGISPITIEQGTLAGSSMTPIGSITTITMGNANTGTEPTILEVPASQSTSNDFVTLSCPLVLSPDAPDSEAIIRYAGGPSVLAPSFSGPISLNGRDLHLENTSNVNTPTRLYNVSGAISGIGNVRVRGGTLPSGEAGTTIRVTSTANTFTGDLYVQTGRLQTGFSTTAGQEHIPNSALLIMSAGTSMGLATTAETIRGLVGGAATQAVPFNAVISQGRGDSNTTRLTVSDSDAANTHVFDGRIVDSTAGPMAFTKDGAATQVLTGVNAYTGTTLINGGILEIGGAGQLNSGAYAGNMTLGSGATFKYNSTASQSLSGIISGAGSLVKDHTGSLTLRGANTFSGNIILDGGKLSATKMGASLTTRTITVDSDAVLEFGTGNVFGGHFTINVPEIIVNGGTITNTELVITDPLLIKVNNALGNLTLNNGTLTATQGNGNSLINATTRPGEGYGAWGLNGTVTSTGTSFINTGAVTGMAGRVLLSSNDNIGDTVFNVVDGTLTVSAPLQQGDAGINNFGLKKTGEGTLTLTAANIYTGDTTVIGGTLELTESAQLKFVLGASSGVNNSLAGIGSVVLDGDFVIDTSAADALPSGSWTLVDVSTLTGPYGSSFSVIGFVDAGDQKWTKANGAKTYTFDETTGILSLVTGPGFSSWITTAFANGTIPEGQRGPSDDFDNDGIRNLIEYAIAGQDPTVPNPTVGSFTDGLLSFTKRPGTAGITYAIQESTDLGINDVWTEVSGVNYVNNPSTISYPLSLGNPPGNFLRLKVTSQTP